MFETSADTVELDDALAKAQLKIKPAGKSSLNPHFRKKYADLSDVYEACREALASEGISVTQWPQNSQDGQLGLITRLAFKGQWMKSSFQLPVAKNDAQSYGAAITYLRRFGLTAAVGVVSTDDDDDANKEAVLQDSVAAQKEQVAKVHNPPKNYAPGAQSPKDDRPVAPKMTAPTGDQELDNYKVDFGKHEGKTMRQIGPLECRKYLEWLIEAAKKDGKPMSDSALTFQKMYHKWMQLMEAQRP